MKAGQLIADRYVVRGMLGKGGMGEVYLADDQRLQTEVALKRVPLALALEPSIREALVSEARILARLSHTHIVRLFDLADTVDGLFLVLEFVCGPSLDKVLIRRNQLAPAEVLRIVDHVAEGLTLAHNQGVFHRDLKPSNLLVAFDGDDKRRYLRDGTHPATLENSLLKVTDFGLAKVVEQMSRANVSGVIAGTPRYMAPEQFRGELASAETDVYALGLIAYECLLGQSPVGTAQPMYFHLSVTPPAIPAAPAHMNAAIQKALRKERKDRFHSAAEFAAALRAPIVTPPATRRWWPIPVAAAIIIPAVLHFNSSPISAPPAPIPVAEKKVEIAPLPPLNPAPRVDTPPPVIEQARAPQTVTLPRGITKPKLLNTARVPSQTIVAEGPNSLIFLSDSNGGIGAVQDGKLLWAYSLGHDAYHYFHAPDGLLWVETYSSQRVYAFNAVGQGGELKQGKMPPYKRAADPPACPESLLDHRCAGDPILDPASGSLLIQTVARTLYFVSKDGRVQWTFPAPCKLDDLTLLPDGTAVGTCDQRKQLLGVKNGQQAFSLNSERQFSSLFGFDRDSNFYVLESTEIYDQKNVLKLSPRGETAWSFPLTLPLGADAKIGRDGRLYLFTRSPGGTILFTVGDAIP